MLKRYYKKCNEFVRAHARRFRITGGVIATLIIVVLGIFFAFETQAVPGEFAVYRESGGYESITTSKITLPFDTTVSEGTGFSIDGTDTNVTLSEQGHYLIMYNIPTETISGTNHSEIQGLIDLGNWDMPYGRSTCSFVRQSGIDECWMAGAAVIESTSTDQTLSIEAYRTDSNSSGVRRRPNESGLMAVRFDDAWSYARLRHEGTGQTFNDATWKTVIFDTQDELDSGLNYSSGAFTLADSGHYLITSSVQFRVSVSSARNMNTRFTLDGYELPGTRVSAFMGGTNSSEDAVASFVGIVEATSTNQVLRLEGMCESETCGNTLNVGGETAITITKLPDTADYIRLTETSDGQAVDATNDPITWDTQLEVDTDAFSHATNTNSSRVTTETDGDYLFFGSFFADRTSTNDTDKQMPHWEWRSNGSSVIQYGSFASFNQGDDGSTGAWTSGNAGGILFSSLTEGDYVELLNTDEGTVDDPTTTFQSERIGVQGVRLASLITPDVTVTALGSHTSTSTVPVTDMYFGTFVLRAGKGDETITDITITETGTVDASAGLSDIRLYYDLDTSSPYNCDSESYNGTETQFGATSTFASANGSTTFSGSLGVGTSSTMCAYVVANVTDSAGDAETVVFEVTDPSVDVVLSDGPTGPEATVVSPTGNTTLVDDTLTQTHYHWRDDDGNETTASSATGGSEDTVLIPVPKNQEQRLRLGISNEGSTTSDATIFRLEYTALSNGSCSASVGWTDVDAIDDAWNTYDSTNLTNGDDTTNISIANGGVTDENSSFISNNNGVLDTTSESSSLTIDIDEFTELEYAVVPTNTANEGTTYCFRVTDSGTALPRYDNYAQITIAADVYVSATSTQKTYVDAGTNDVYIGGVFSISDLIASRDVTEVILTEDGTVDAQNSLSDIRLYYEFDTSDPYDCASESFDGTENQYGATSSAFSAGDGTATFTETVGVSTTSTLCLYPVFDVAVSASSSATVELSIANPSTQVSVSSGSVSPDFPVALNGTTTIRAAVFEQLHYHFRNDDGTEAGASSATEGIEDTPITQVAFGDAHRIRFMVSNEGATTSTSTVFGLQYGTKNTTCDATAWNNIHESGGAWTMSDSPNLTDGDDTTNISIAIGGVTDENTTFLTPNGGVLDTTGTSSPLSVAETEFVELEYAVEATPNAEYGDTYCFRVVANGESLATYDVYPQATTRQNQDFYIQRGDMLIAGTSSTITAGVDYVAPSASTSAFIRITNTQLTGAGRSSLGGTQNADMVTVFMQNPWNLTDSVTFERADDTSDTYVAWEIIEYTGPVGGDNEMVVRSAEQYDLGSGDSSTSIGTTGVIDDSDVVVFITALGNPDGTTGNYNRGLVTSDWDGVLDEVILERNESGTEVQVNYAVVEFTGLNWNIQRAEHTYSSAGTWETETISTVNDIDRTFLHVQKRSSVPGIDEYGHEVYLHNAIAVRFYIQGGATSPSGQTSVAWVIENTQTNGTPMKVYRSNGTQTGGAERSIVEIAIGTTTRDITTTSIFTNNRVTGSDTSFPRPMMGVIVASTSAYELWISDTAQTRSYRTEVVDWPTAVLAVEQNYYRFYVDNDAIDPTDPWPVGATDLGENTAITGTDMPPYDGDRIRVRMSLHVSGASISAETNEYALEYGVRDTSCAAISSWVPVGGAGSTTAIWRGYNASPLSGSALGLNPPAVGELNLSVSDRAGTYEEGSPTATNPYKVFIGEDVEYDWILEANGITDLTSYCFRMVESDGDTLDDYTYYPTLTVAGFVVEQGDWRWYDDEDSITPSVPLAASNTAPSNISVKNAIKLRVLVNELAGKAGENTKYKLQWSEYSDFSVVNDVVDTDMCGPGSRWCYYNGGGAEGATITASVLDGADSCSGGTGDGCGTHNEYSYTPDVVGEVGTTSTDSTGTTVTLQHTYDDPVFIVESISGDDSGGSSNNPAVAIITATTTSSFTVRIQEPDNEADTHGSEEVSYIVMERGAYTLPDGRRVDVDTIDTTDYYGNAVAGTSDDTCTFTQSFDSAPVVLASLQSDNNTGTPDFLTASLALITSSNFACSMEVPDGETNTPSSSETIGWIAIEGGTFANNAIPIEATSTSVSITGWDDTPWYEQTFTQIFTDIPGAVFTKQTRNGAEGGWVRYDSATTDSIVLAMDERDDGERNHTSEKVGYLAFGESGVLYRGGTSDFTFTDSTVKEFEFTLQHHDAQPNVTYFFRLFDTERSEAVTISSTTSAPSLSTEGATLSFTISGINAGSSTEGIVTDATTTATSVPFGSLPLGSPVETAQRFTVSTNATEGYQILAYERQDLISGAGATIEDITGTNDSPTQWAVGCVSSAESCYGYHVGDNTLENGSTRFLLNDTYARLTTTPAEVAYSSVPVLQESTDIVYRIQVAASQPAGTYESQIGFIIVPVF
jgi:hypothetical protein